MKLILVRAAAVLAVFLTMPVWFHGQSTGSPLEKDFVSDGKLEITLESGGYEVRPSADNRIHVRWNEASGKGVAVKLSINGKTGDLRVENTPKNFHATIDVPAVTNLRIRLTAGALAVGAIKGDKDIELNAGDVKVACGSASDWGDVDASVVAGDLHASAFEAQRGGLFRSFQWKGPGRYRLHVHATAGNITLQK